MRTLAIVPASRWPVVFLCSSGLGPWSGVRLLSTTFPFNRPYLFIYLFIYWGLRFAYSQYNRIIRHWKNTKSRFQEALLNGHFSWQLWLFIDYCQIHLPAGLVLHATSACALIMIRSIITMNTILLYTVMYSFEHAVSIFILCILLCAIQCVDSRTGLSNAAPVIYFPGALFYSARFNVNQNFKKKIFLNNSMFQFFS
jgi:hypothetical protein